MDLITNMDSGCDTEIFAGGNSHNFGLINYSWAIIAYTLNSHDSLWFLGRETFPGGGIPVRPPSASHTDGRNAQRGTPVHLRGTLMTCFQRPSLCCLFLDDTVAWPSLLSRLSLLRSLQNSCFTVHFSNSRQRDSCRHIHVIWLTKTV